MMFQLPTGEWPHPDGTRLRSRSRPWWGVGVVEAAPGGCFAVLWTSDGGVRSRWLYTPEGWAELDAVKCAD